MAFKEMLDYCQAQAIIERLEPTEDSVWRSLARRYSKTFHTPLHQVMELDFEFVVRSVYADDMDDFNLNKNAKHLFDVVSTMIDPNHQAVEDEKMDDFIRAAEAEEEERVRNNKPIPKKKSKQKNNSENPDPASENNTPSGGTLDMSRFDHLEQDEGGGF